MGIKVKEVADLVGISVRTLHHYDEIGLLTPEATTTSGYRLYSEEDLECLQQILFFKELGFPLKKIREIISSPSFNKSEALELHRKYLIDKRSRLDKIIATIDKTIEHTKGEINMSNKEKFEGFDFSQNPYEQEARERWGEKAVDDSNKKISSMSKKEKETANEKMIAIYTKLAELRYDSPASDEAQAAIKDWYDLLNNNFGSYNLETFKGLGKLYVDDKRFTKNIDKMGEGLAKFMSEAMAIFTDSKK
ncbi:DNA-binding transcriptional MerR regulator [Salirhabdus euzebyi]|uniref:DNA-binding transcriptional MerR regulator n=1 Tax=Salirhabdus euzebyi TaxID=394506 RepID=A0A841PUF9_9BACI|nr:MerR family transcriptional regulator [Salirhabdus euzebyi]MBB6452637.1 DNA-binding transcriptional MerR regulator [Salirhabdus euzebyi]